ncbi:MAG: hypothetical protein GX554_00925 [Elusimicrobia bacterium]|nr:hypothetical protein [Elusimicrobiota bacterium]
MKKLFIYAVLIGMCFAQGLYCKNAAVAMVGNKIILESDVRSKMSEISGDYEVALRDVVIENMLLFEAEKEGIIIEPEEFAFEVERIKQGFADEASFYAALDKENMPYSLFVQMIENKIKVNAIVKKNVIDKIQISSSEVAEKMREMSDLGNYTYRFRLKWFGDDLSAQEFIEGFDIANEEEMGDAVTLSKENISSEVLAGIEQLSPNELSGPIKVGDRYLVVMLKEAQRVEANSYQLYLRVRNMLLNMKFEDAFNNYLRELQLKTPVFYVD